MDKLRIDIDGMSCGHCVKSVEQALSRVDGLTAESVRVGAADVTFDASRVSTASIVAAIADAGFTAHVPTAPR